MNPTATQKTSCSPRPGGLAALGEVKLRAGFEQMLAQARAQAGGTAPWRLRKIAELRDLLALAEISHRLRIEWLDLSTDLRAVVALRTPVPLRGPQSDAPLEIGALARLALMYRPEVLVAPQPGYSFAQVLSPRGIWHPNCSRDDSQSLCLGTQLPIGIPLKEIVLMIYGALTLQSVQFSVSDSAGVMNGAAAEWWQSNVRRIPLSREPFVVNPASPP